MIMKMPNITEIRIFHFRSSPPDRLPVNDSLINVQYLSIRYGFAALKVFSASSEMHEEKTYADSQYRLQNGPFEIAMPDKTSLSGLYPGDSPNKT
jgi:hypothetical protein